MNNSFEVVNQNGKLIWSFEVFQDDQTANVKSTYQDDSVPGFQDVTIPLLMNTIERWCIINELTLRPVLTLEKPERAYDYYTLNGEPVFICFKWMVQAKFYRRKSKRVRVETFEVHAQDRESAKDLAERKFKGASMRELLSLTPCGFGWCYYKNRPGHPNIEPHIIERLPMPENL